MVYVNLPEGKSTRKPQLSTPARAPVASVHLLNQLFHLFHIEQLTWEVIRNSGQKTPENPIGIQCYNLIRQPVR
jgi:hypothetical protein